MKKIFSIIFLSLLFLFSAAFIQAEGLVPCGPGTAKQYCELCDFFVMIERIIDFLLLPPPAGGGVVLALAVLMIAVGGFMYVIAYAGAGGPEMVSRAKKLFTAVAIGLLIIYSAFLIIGLFLKFIGLADWTENIYQNWIRGDFFEIQCDSSSGGNLASGGGIFPGGGNGTFKGSGATGSIPAPESPPDCGSCGKGFFVFCDEEKCDAIQGCIYADAGNCVAPNDCEKCGPGLATCNVEECKKIGDQCSFIPAGIFSPRKCVHK